LVLVALDMSESHGQQFGYVGVVERIIYHAPIPAMTHDAQVPQHAQVLRDRRNGQANPLRQRTDAPFAL